MEMQVYGCLFYTTSDMRTMSNPLIGMQAIPLLYFAHFGVLTVGMTIVGFLKHRKSFYVGGPFTKGGVGGLDFETWRIIGL